MSLTTTTHVPIHICICGQTLDAASEIRGNSKPSENDFTLCLNCGFIWVFNADLTLRRPTDEDIKSAESNPEFYIKLIAARTLITSKKYL